MHSDIVCGLDIGSSSIRALAVRCTCLLSKDKKESDLIINEDILGFTQSPTKGFTKGVVSSLNLLSDVIEDTVSRLEAQTGRKIRRVVSNIAGVHIRTFKSRGSVHISDRPSEITDQDVHRVIESARLIAMSLDRELIHLVPVNFYIDDKIQISEPRGLFGSKLDVDLNLVTSLVSILQNLTKAINLAGYELEELIVSGAATALGIFEKKELYEGAIVIDVGKDMTEVTVFNEEKIRECFYFPFGSDDITQVLQDRLRIMFKEAEELRIKYGIVTKDNQGLFDNSQILISPLGNKSGPGHENAQSDRNRSGGSWVDSDVTSAGAPFINKERATVISRREISNMLFPKVEEIMQDVYKKIEPFLRQRRKLPHIHVVGGISRMDGFVESVEAVFGVPVSMGRIRNAKGLSDYNFMTCLGLIRHGAYNRLEKKAGHLSGSNNFIGRFLNRARSVFSEYF